VLAQARERAPKRQDIVLALARSSEEAGYYGDSALAYDEYRQLRPGGEEASRDPVGYFDQAQLLWRTDPERALQQLFTAARLDPNFAGSCTGRAGPKTRFPILAYLSLDRAREAEAVLRPALAVSPDDPEALMHLGRALMALNRGEETQPFWRNSRRCGRRDGEIPAEKPG
jgi:tetratricopeptide (TPR) repeat protein